MNKQLFLSILSMDAYNRGYIYGAGITKLSEAGNIGLATIRPFEPREKIGWEESDFYSIAYRVGDASGGLGYNFVNQDENILVYRGTDNFTKDPDTGYGIALGRSDGPQATLAVKFYTAVTGASLGQSANATILTGHSLGGGLAGYVATVSGIESVVFDYMPFGVAVEDRLQFLTQSTPSFSLVTGFHVESEFLVYARNGLYQNLSETLEIGGLAGLEPGQLEDLALRTRETESRILNTELESFRGGLSLFHPKEHHSVAMLVSLLYAEQADIPDDWHNAAPQLWDAFFDESLATSVNGLQDRRGRLLTGDLEEAGTVLRSAIAYSAISEGERPFGDTAIRAMFDDAGDLGRILQGASSSSPIAELAGALSKTVVEYAGSLAIHDIEANPPIEQMTRDPLYVRQAQASLDGILSYRPDQGALSIDYTSDRWSFANGGAMPAIAGKAEMLEKLFPAMPLSSSPKAIPTLPAPLYDETPTSAAVSKATLDLWGTGSLDTFDRVSLAIGSGGARVTIQESTRPGRAGLFVGGSGGDEIIGSNGTGEPGTGRDLLIGNSGVDKLYGLGGDDIIFGGSEFDTLAGGSGDNLLIGGSGFDTYRVSAGDEGTTTIQDDGGILLLADDRVGRHAAAAAGSLESGLAVLDQGGTFWQLGGFRATWDDADLRLDNGNQHLVLKSFRDGDYGIRLGAQASSVETNFLLDDPNTLNVYRKVVVIGDRTIVRFTEAYAYEATPDLGTFERYVYADLGGGTDAIRTRIPDLSGTDADDYLNLTRYAAENSFTVSTGSGRDYIEGNNSLVTATTVFAGAGQDTIVTHGGAGSVSGEEGDDTFGIRADRGLASLTNLFGGDGRDLFLSADGIGARSIDGGAGVDHLNLGLAADPDGYNKVAIDLTSQTFVVDDIALDYKSIERLSLATGNSDDEIRTLQHDDVLNLGGGRNIVDAGEGRNSVIFGDGSINRLVTGDGSDGVQVGEHSTNMLTLGQGDNLVVLAKSAVSEITLGDGADTISVTDSTDGNGHSRIYAGGGRDLLLGLGGGDELYGESGDDDIHGNPGADFLYGGAGDDLIVGHTQLLIKIGNFADNRVFHIIGAVDNYRSLIGSDADWMAGGDGNDEYLVDSANDTVVENEDEGVDTVFSVVSLSAIANVENIRLVGVDAIDAAGDNRANLIVGNSASNIIRGGEGDDTLQGGYGDLTTTAGNDTLYGEAGDDLISLGSGAGAEGYAYGGDGNDRVSGGFGNDYLSGGEGNDYIYSSFGNDIIDGGAGNDYLIESLSSTYGTAPPSSRLAYNFSGSYGNDTIDTLYSRASPLTHSLTIDGRTLSGEAQYQSAQGWKLISSGATYVIEGSAFQPASGESYNTRVKIYREGDSQNSITITSMKISSSSAQGDFGIWFGGPSTLPRPDETGYVELPDSLAKADYSGTDRALTIVGGVNDNLIIATRLSDVVRGNDGRDRIEGGLGDDSIDGGAGRDWLDGGNGNDRLRGGDEADVFLFDNQVASGRDKILDFSSDDLLVTTARIYDSNNDGIIKFGSNKSLDLFGSSTVDVINASGRRVTVLEFDGMTVRDDITYYVYSAVGSAAGVGDLAAYPL